MKFTRLFLLFCMYSITCAESKIVGLVAVKNEQNCIEQCLRALSLYTDAIVILDDASEDDTLSIIKPLAQKYNLHIIAKNVWSRDEARDRNTLLDRGRALNGTHFIVIDADEMFTAPCMHHNYLRKQILKMNPGDYMSCWWINLYNDAQQYDNQYIIKPFIFCDDGNASYDNSIRIHAERIPENLHGTNHVLQPISQYGLLHFKYVNWENVLIRNAWYQCLMSIMWPEVSRKEVGSFFKQKLVQQSGNLRNTNPRWLDYPFFTAHDFSQPDTWRKQQIIHWIETYGTAYFNDLSIWHLDFIQKKSNP